MIKRLIHWENITSINIYKLNIQTPECKEMLSDQKIEIDNNKITAGNFNILLSASRHKTNPEIWNLNHTFSQINLTDIYRAFVTTESKYKRLSIACRIVFSISHMIGHKTNFSKFKKCNHIDYLFWPKWCEIRNQQQKEKGKITNIWN